MNKLAEMYDASKSFPDYADRYLENLHKVLQSIDLGEVARVTAAIEEASRKGKTLFTIANGGSAAACSHMVNDLVAGSYLEEKPRLRALCLTDNVESVTAIANDRCFEDIFAYQLRVHLEPGDVVLAMSVSGNSENLVRAVNYARDHGATTIGYCGMDGGKLREACDIVVYIPASADEYGPVEDSFNILGHLVTGYLAMSRGKRLHH